MARTPRERYGSNTRAARWRRQRGYLRWAALGFTVVVVVFACAVLALRLAERNQIVPGVKAWGVDVGGKSRGEAERLLAGNGYLAQPLTLTLDDRSWQLTPAQLGLRFDARETAEKAFKVGRRGNVARQLWEGLSTRLFGRSVSQETTIDQQQQDVALAVIAAETDQAPMNASLALEGLEVLIRPAQAGRVVDLEAAKRELARRFEQRSLDPVALNVVEATPTIFPADLESAKTQTELMLSAPVFLTYQITDTLWSGKAELSVEERRLETDRDSLAAMVSFGLSNADGRAIPWPLIDPAAAQQYGGQIAEQVERPVREARFDLEGDRLRVLSSGQAGYRLVSERLADAIQQAALAEDRTAELPLEVLKPKVDLADLSGMGGFERIGLASTYYGAAIPEKQENVALAAGRITGTVIPDGAVFSYDETIGEVSEKTGYKMGLSIVGDTTVPDFGGGVCQVSTTVFQAAFWAGLPIVERHEHAYRVASYEPPAGLDATVSVPTLDLKFKNNTGQPVLLLAWTEEGRVYVGLYGRDPGWTVSMIGPEITNVRPPDTTETIIQYSTALEKGREIWGERAGDGCDVSLTRVVEKYGQEIARDTFVSHFRPTHNLLVVGTGGEPPPDAAASPAPTPAPAPEPTTAPEPTPTSEPTTAPTPAP